MKKETTENKQEAEGNVSQNNAITENMGNGSYTSDINPVDSSTEKKHKKKSKRTIFEIVGVIILVMSLLAYSGISDEAEKLSKKYNSLEYDFNKATEELDALKSEYEDYKTKMQPYEKLDAAEAEARQIEADKIVAEEKAKQEKAEAEKKAAEEKAKREAAEKATLEQKNALAKAQDYLSYSAFSHSGLIKQLEYEGFSKDAATYAADNCGANWNEQAAQKAKDYMEFSSFSRSRLISQLKYEGFTDAQAQYGATAVGY